MQILFFSHQISSFRPLVVLHYNFFFSLHYHCLSSLNQPTFLFYQFFCLIADLVQKVINGLQVVFNSLYLHEVRIFTLRWFIEMILLVKFKLNVVIFYLGYRTSQWSWLHPFHNVKTIPIRRFLLGNVTDKPAAVVLLWKNFIISIFRQWNCLVFFLFCSSELRFHLL